MSEIPREIPTRYDKTVDVDSRLQEEALKGQLTKKFADTSEKDKVNAAGADIFIAGSADGKADFLQAHAKSFENKINPLLAKLPVELYEDVFSTLPNSKAAANDKHLAHAERINLGLVRQSMQYVPKQNGIA